MKTEFIGYVLLLIFCGVLHNPLILTSTIDHDLRLLSSGYHLMQNSNNLIFQLKSRACMTEIILKNFLTLEDIFVMRLTCKEFEDLVIINGNEIKTICGIPMVNGLYCDRVPKWYINLPLEQKNCVDMFLVHSSEGNEWLDHRLIEKTGAPMNDVKKLTHWYFFSKKMSQIKNENLLMFQKSKNQIFQIKNKGNQGKACALLTNEGTVHYWGPDNRQLNCLTNVKKIVSGTKAIFALTNDKIVFGWGDLGPERGAPILTPTPKELFENVVDVICVDFGVAVLKTDKSVKMYGNSFVVLNEGRAFNVSNLLTGTITKIDSSDRVFGARRKNGGIVFWGEKVKDELTRDDGKEFVQFIQSLRK